MQEQKSPREALTFPSAVYAQCPLLFIHYTSLDSQNQRYHNDFTKDATSWGCTTQSLSLSWHFLDSTMSEEGGQVAQLQDLSMNLCPAQHALKSDQIKLKLNKNT